MLNPGGVGLGILDSFVSGVPMITTKCGLHGPEIAYLRPNKNGLLTENTLADFVSETINLLSNGDWYKNVALSARKDSRRYTINNMTHNFSDGIKKALTL